MSTCPFPGCTVQIPATKFGCPKHWWSLSKDAQARIWASYRAYKAHKIGLEELRRIQNEVLAGAQGVKR